MSSFSISTLTKTPAVYSRTIKLVVLLVTTALSAVVQAVTVDVRSETECVFLSNRIWCYGGQGYISSSSDNVASGITNEPLFFSLDPFQNTSPFDMRKTFDAEKNDVGPNLYHTLVAVPGINAIVMDGGMGIGDGKTIPQRRTTIYNPDSKTWTTNTPSPHMRVYGHTATLGPNNTIYFWGGRRDQNTTGEEGTLVDIPFRMHWFNVAKNTWSLGSPVHTITERRQFHKAVLGKDGSSIYYIGGLMPLSIMNQSGMTDYDDYAEVPMNVITIFDTKSGAWRSENTTGATVPSTRIRHTLTLKPNTGEIILIGGIAAYGDGSREDYRPREDYFYILNTEKLEWSNRTIEMEDSSGILEGICGHSAVLVGSRLFILFGFNEFRLLSRGFTVLDVDKWKWLSQLDQSSPTSTDDDNDDGGSYHSYRPRKNLTGGQISGIVIGATAGAFFIAAAIFLFVRKRRQNAVAEKLGTMEDETPPAPLSRASTLYTSPPPSYTAAISGAESNNQQASLLRSSHDYHAEH